MIVQRYMKCVMVLFTLSVLCGKIALAEAVAPVVKITNPSNGSRFKACEKIAFEGSATDLEDGDISGSSLSWTSDLDGFIGEGNSFTRTLSDGSHIILLTVHDSEGNQSRASAFIMVGDFNTPADLKDAIPKMDRDDGSGDKGKTIETKIPSIEFLEIPPFSSTQDLRGRVLNADPKDSAVAVCIMVEGGWWSKPGQNKVIKVNDDGTWICDITTQKMDRFAVRIAAYLIPANFKSPVVEGNIWLPKELETKCLAKVEVTRKIRNTYSLDKKHDRAEVSGPRTYFPLAVGNMWRYKKTVYKKGEVYYCMKQAVTKPGWTDRPVGRVYIVLGRDPEMKPETLIETYKITGKSDNGFFTVEVDGGNIPRDGRYSNFSNKPSIVWGYAENSVMENILAEDMGADTENKVQLAVLKPNIILTTTTKEDEEILAVGSKKYERPLKTSLGTFSNCLMNCTLVNGTNLTDVLTKDLPAEFLEKDFGCFRTNSFFAPGVGLVKEIQYNTKGEVTYELELIEYEVKGD